MPSLDIVPIDTRVKYQLEHSREVLTNVHSSSVCAGRPCPIHNLTSHSMRAFPQHFRSDRGIMERICPHGIGHPDPDDVYSLGRPGGGVHGCDGCCHDSRARVRRIKALRTQGIME